MPGDNEMKQMMTEKVFPFFESGLKDILSTLENLKEATGEGFTKFCDVLVPIVKKLEYLESEFNEEKIRNLIEEILDQRVKKASGKEIEEKPIEKEPDAKATVKIDNSGRAKVVKKKKTKK